MFSCKNNLQFLALIMGFTLASLRHTYLGSFFYFWTQRTLGCWVCGPSGTLLKGQGFYNLVQNRGHRGPALRPRCIGPGEGPYPIYHSILWVLRWRDIQISTKVFPPTIHGLTLYNLHFYYRPINTQRPMRMCSAIRYQRLQNLVWMFYQQLFMLTSKPPFT